MLQLKKVSFLLYILSSLIVTCTPAPLVSFASPFNKYDANGARTITGWQPQYDTRINRGGLRLTMDASHQHGEFWSNTIHNIGVGQTFSMLLTFRISGRGGRDSVGGSLVFYLVRDDYTPPDPSHDPNHFYGSSSKGFPLGLAIVVDRPQDKVEAAFAERVSLWVDDGNTVDHKPRMLKSCRGAFQYDENRHDFETTKSSALRVVFNKGSVNIEIDERSTGAWKPCISVDNTGVRAENLHGGRVGFVADTAEYRNSIEVKKLIIHDNLDGAKGEISAPTFDSRASEIFGTLEHQLFEINVQLSRTVYSLESKIEREWEHIAQLEEQLSAGYLDSLEHRMLGIENAVVQAVMPWISEAKAAMIPKIDQVIADTTSETLGITWVKPFLLGLFLLCGFAAYHRRQFATLKKLNSRYM